MSPLQSWMCVGAALLAAFGLVVLMDLRRPKDFGTTLSPELRGPEPEESLWRYAPHLAIVIAAFLLVGTMDYEELARDGRTQAAYAAKE